MKNPRTMPTLRWDPPLLALLAVVSAAVSVGTPVVAVAAPEITTLTDSATANPGPAETSVSPLRIVVGHNVDDAALLKEWIIARNPQVEDVIPKIEGHEQWLAVKIGGITYDYTVSVVAMRDGAPLREDGEPPRCECTSEQLLDFVDGQIVAVAKELQLPNVVESEDRRSGSKQPRLEPTTPVPTDGDHPVRRLSPRGSVGIALIVLGAGIAAGGVPLFLQPNELKDTQGTFELVTMQKPAIGLMAGGGVALVTGIALLASDVAQRGKRSMSAAPTFGLQHAGVTITRRF